MIPINEPIIGLSVAGLALVPVVIALTELAKIYMSSHYAPLLSLSLGIGGVFLLPHGAVSLTIIEGIVVGLSASGLYSGAKKGAEVIAG